MATYSGGLAENSWNDWDQELRLSRRDPLGGNRTSLNKDVTASSMIGSDDDLYKSLGLDRNAEMLKNPYAQGLSPKQVVGGVTPEKSWFGDTMDFIGSEQGNNLLGNITMGANLLTKAYMLPTAIKNMELQNKALDKNIEIAQYGLDKSKGFSNALAAAQNNQGLAARSVA